MYGNNADSVKGVRFQRSTLLRDEGNRTYTRKRRESLFRADSRPDSDAVLSTFAAEKRPLQAPHSRLTPPVAHDDTEPSDLACGSDIWLRSSEINGR